VKQPGQVAILKFPQTDLAPGKPRPVLLIARLLGPYDDWLVSMIFTQLQQSIEGFDEVIDQGDDDFHVSGLKVPSVIRISRLAVVSADLLVGAIGQISPHRMRIVQRRLAEWISGRT